MKLIGTMGVSAARHPDPQMMNIEAACLAKKITVSFSYITPFNCPQQQKLQSQKFIDCSLRILKLMTYMY